MAVREMTVVNARELDRVSYVTLGRFLGLADIAGWGTVDAATILTRLIEIRDQFHTEKQRLERENG